MQIICSKRLLISARDVYKRQSDYRKPNAMTVITKKNFKKIVWPLKCSDMIMVGPATTRQLNQYGIYPPVSYTHLQQLHHFLFVLSKDYKSYMMNLYQDLLPDKLP